MDLSNSFDFTHYKYLNIGGGNFEHRADGWLNLDCQFEATEHKRDWSMIDINCNLMKMESIPLPDNSIRAIYSEHAIEHLLEDAVYKLLNEAYRILVPGGTIRIAVPDAEKFYNMIADDSVPATDFPSVWSAPKRCKTKQQIFIDAVCTPLEGHIDDSEIKESVDMYRCDLCLDKFYHRMLHLFKGMTPEEFIEKQADNPGWHLSWWSHRKLVTFLQTKGFVDISSSLNRNESRLKFFRRCPYIDRTAHKITVRIEASKPDA